MFEPTSGKCTLITSSLGLSQKPTLDLMCTHGKTCQEQYWHTDALCTYITHWMHAWHCSYQSQQKCNSSKEQCSSSTSCCPFQADSTLCAPRNNLQRGDKVSCLAISLCGNTMACILIASLSVWIAWQATCGWTVLC